MADDKEKVNQLVDSWRVHPSVSLGYGKELGRILLPGINSYYLQDKLDLAVRLNGWLDEYWNLGAGFTSGLSFDTMSPQGLGKPGSSYGGFDIALGWQKRPQHTDTAQLGLELRQAALFGTISGTQLWQFWLRTSVRPHISLPGLHLDLAMPLSVSWRRDNGPIFEFSLEAGGVL